MVKSEVMKRVFAPTLCVLLVTFLAGCNVWSIIWQGIIGKGYYQLTQATIMNNVASMTANPIDLTTLTTSSVIIYKTSASGLYGKLSLTTAPITGSLKIMFQTYAVDGTSYASSSSVTITSGSSFSLETGIETSASASDFLYAAPGILTPYSPAVFYLMP